jgi:hypothetical protein
MDDSARLKLQQMIKANDVKDQTDTIRELKHSSLLRENVKQMIMLKQGANFEENAIRECHFLYSNYTDIFNKIKKDEIDLDILFQFFNVLEKIENSELDQHEGSFEVGTLLKKLYVDSALKKADKLNENREEVVYKTGSSITWKQFKNRT